MKRMYQHFLNCPASLYVLFFDELVESRMNCTFLFTLTYLAKPLLVVPNSSFARWHPFKAKSNALYGWCFLAGLI